MDTGASYTIMPRPMLEELKVKPHTRASFLLANGQQAELDVGRTWVRLDGRQEFTLVVFGERESQPLLGAVTLEEFRLAPDPVSKRLIAVPGLLM